MPAQWSRQKAAKIESFSEQEIWERGIELWEGEVVEKFCPFGKCIDLHATRLYNLLYWGCERTPDLWEAAEYEAFILKRNPDTLFRPDAALYRARPESDSLLLDFAPDLAAEILSEDISRPALLAKRNIYLSAGTEQVWLLDPKSGTLEIHLSDGRYMTATDGIVEGEGVAQGLRVDLAWLFAPSSSGCLLPFKGFRAPS